MTILAKKDLASQLHNEKRFGMSKKEAIDIIETLFDLIVCHFQNDGESIVLRGFGTFKLKHRKAFVGSHPKDKSRIDIAEKCSLSFKPCAEVLRRINS